MFTHRSYSSSSSSNSSYDDGMSAALDELTQEMLKLPDEEEIIRRAVQQERDANAKLAAIVGDSSRRPRKRKYTNTERRKMIIQSTMQSPTPPPPSQLCTSTTTTTTTTTTKPAIVAFTTPSNYANRLLNLFTLKGFTPLWCPTITIQCTPQTISSLKPYLHPQNPNHHHHQPPPLDDFSAIAFTSRTSISAFHDAMIENNDDTHPLSPNGETFTIAALGNDSALLDNEFVNRICENPNRIRIMVPPIATPSGLVEELGPGFGRRILCPVPMVVGLEEPPVVPNFLRDLGLNGWVPVRVYGYETRWAGPSCAVRVAEGELDAIVFTSTGEVEGLLKSLRGFGLSWEMVRKMRPRLVVAAHGPVTAAGAERLGVDVDVVSPRFDSLEGVVDALDLKLKALH